MPLLSWLLADYTLTKKLRNYSENYVKINELDKARSRALVRDYVEGHIIEYCRQYSPLPILRLEYTGSVYERLKTEASDEVDLMVVLKTDKPWFWGVSEVIAEKTDYPGYVRLKARDDSKLLAYTSPEGYINPERLRNGWFHSLLAQAVNAFNNSSPSSDVSFNVRYHGPSVQLDIMKKRSYVKLLSVDLVPCFEAAPGKYFVPKSSKCLSVPHPELLWRQSFSLREKDMLQCMDRNDHGCRHELLRIVKTIVNRDPTSLGRLDSYNLKTAFLHYISERRENWAGRNSLGKHFVGFLKELQSWLERGNLPHYWLPGVNLLEDINQVVVEQMAYRLKNVLNSRAEMNFILSRNMPQREEEMQNAQGYISSGLRLALELLFMLMENAFKCILFGIQFLLFCILVLVVAFLLLLSVVNVPPPESPPEA